jgi:hypothetical protein
MYLIYKLAQNIHKNLFNNSLALVIVIKEEELNPSSFINRYLFNANRSAGEIATARSVPGRFGTKRYLLFNEKTNC